MKAKTVQTYEAKIYVGLYCRKTLHTHNANEAFRLCQDYCDKVGLCVTFTPTNFIYKGGNEAGCIVGLINYPRFPATKAKIRKTALELAGILLKAMEQQRVSVVFSDRTVMLVDEERIAEA